MFNSSKLKEFADNKFSFDENESKLSKLVENAVGKGEIACYEQFLLFPQCFQKAYFPRASKGVIVWELVNSMGLNPSSSVGIIQDLRTRGCWSDPWVGQFLSQD